MAAGADTAGGGRTVPAARRLIVAALMFLTACSAGPTPSSPSDKSETASSLDTSGVSPSSTQQALHDPIANDAPRIGLSARITAKQALPGDPDWLEVAHGSLWVKRDDGHVSQIDLRTAEPTGQWSTGYSRVPACQGLAYDGTYLWYAPAKTNWPATNRHQAAPPTRSAYRGSATRRDSSRATICCG